MGCGLTSQHMPVPLQRMIFEANNLLTITLLLALALTMIRRQLHRQLPVFVAYLLFDAVSIGVIEALTLTNQQRVAWYAMWVEDSICVALGFLIISDLFSKAFAGYAGLRVFARNVMYGSAAFLLILGVFTTVFFHKLEYTDFVFTVLKLWERSVKLLQLGLIMCLFALTKYLHLRWRNFHFGVALGLGFFALITLADNVVRAYYGKMVAGSLFAVENACYCLTIVIWLVYALQPDAGKIPIVSLPSHELEKWDLALSRFLGHSTSSSIPAARE